MRQSDNGSSPQVEISLNGTSVGKGPVGFAERIERTQNYIGHTQYPGCPKLVGGIGEIILYGRVLSP